MMSDLSDDQRTPPGVRVQPAGAVTRELQYIADSPSQEYGGFNIHVVKTAKNALKEIRRLRRAVRARTERAKRRSRRQRGKRITNTAVVFASHAYGG